MSVCLFISRGLTRTQTMLRYLERSGIPARIVRPPANLVEEGCGYAVQINSTLVNTALSVLRRVNFSPRRIFCEKNGVFSECFGGAC